MDGEFGCACDPVRCRSAERRSRRTARKRNLGSIERRTRSSWPATCLVKQLIFLRVEQILLSILPFRPVKLSLKSPECRKLALGRGRSTECRVFCQMRLSKSDQEASLAMTPLTPFLRGGSSRHAEDYHRVERPFVQDSRKAGCSGDEVSLSQLHSVSWPQNSYGAHGFSQQSSAPSEATARPPSFSTVFSQSSAPSETTPRLPSFATVFSQSSAPLETRNHHETAIFFDPSLGFHVK